MIKHRPKPETNVKIGDVEYKCKHGIVELPEAYPQFNPIEKEKKKVERKPKKDN